MSKLDDLIREYCPDGVEYKELSAVCKSLPKGTLKQEELVKDGLYPVVNSGKELYGYYNDFNNDGDAVIVASRGNAGYVSYQGGKFWAGGLCYPYASADESTVSTKYIYYALKAKENTICNTLVSKGGVPALNKQDLDAVKIPVPPIEVQNKIVQILDTFTELTAELTAELSARQKQYEYYRDMLVKFEGQVPGVENKRLSEVCTFTRGTTITSKETTPGPVPVISGGLTPAFYHNEANRPAGAIIVAGSGANAGFVSMWDVPIFCADSFSVDIKDVTLMNPRFLFYVLKNKQDIISSAKKGGGVPHVHGSDIANISVPVPPIDVQQQVVSILDQFYTFSSDISTGLPAEIAAREKQYEFFRDKILTFKGVTPPRMILALLIAAELIGVERQRVGDVCEILRGKRLTTKELIPNGKYPVVHGGVAPMGYYDKANRKAMTTCVVNTGNAGYVFFSEKEFWSSDACFALYPKPDVCDKYLYYVLKNSEQALIQKQREGAMPTIDSNAVAGLTIPIPPLFIQQAIVNVLDKFESLCADLKEGLPAEIALRQRQYDYYRDALLALPACSH